ncbi:MAG: chemotaxis protein CheB [Desulfobacterales bacterium]|nr:chemotaxis protein CheB [Desulfobacterales bacterium]
MSSSPKSYHALVIGVSAGGLAALTAILPRLSSEMSQPVIIVQHQSPDSDDFLIQHFDKLCSLGVKEAEDKMPVENSTVYFAPANYHLLVEDDKSFALSTAEKVQYSRPSIDVLFETAAEVYQDHLAGLILTGANADGTKGVMAIRKYKGFTIAQSPETAEVDFMPKSAIAEGVDAILDLEDIAPFINRMMTKGFNK